MIEYILLGVLLLIVVILFLIVANLSSKVNRLNFLMKRIEEKNVSVKMMNQIEKLENDVEVLIEQNYKHDGALANTFSKHGIERFNAFGNVGGKLSFSLALLNNDETGYILTSIHQDEGSYVFVKEVIRGDAYQELSDEEVMALNKAKNLVVVNNVELE